MQQAHGVEVPETVAEMCRPAVSAVLVYDAQQGILAHVHDREGVLRRTARVLDAARAAGVPVVYARHVSLPPSHLGVAGLRTAMAWQRVQRADAVRAAFPPDAPQTRIVEEVAPRPGEPVLDKLGMSALVGTPLELLLRDRRVTTLVLVGAVLEIGIEPTARHAADLGFLPVVVDDACGVVQEQAAARARAALDHTFACYRAGAEEVAAAFAR
ncbi:cysteine hydrolase [Kineococcus indalonis]|uniref:cysteine hydrolase n=1 Tax=Kineococcus indalonis TaxID=2696566 RepID=UPI001412FE5B|nr:cysteine hydrolase [Kineococcus indalonis]NAZ84592.1 isochorismatase family protein [Kineococcus indalonis]